MHIEITGRMTGKTTRLIAAASKKRQEGKKVVIVLSTPLEKERLWAFLDIASKVNGACVTSCDMLNLNRRKELPQAEREILEALIKDSDACWFFDEFDWYENQLDIPIMPNGYYTTTPRPGFDLMNASGDRVINKLLTKAETFVDTVLVMPCNSGMRAEGMDFWGIDYVA
ncbi:hypothetical protein LA374_00520 [Aeromonas schubertii]|uniref:Uncharacterized protein n=1 Tax=Aeromonas schubertii TaxID=652 RepID=A0ABS7V6J9_9GAMM|nr:hypothetical protein [Aeromonas schubertii]MBZ6064702.1 hypothetical protein [Aeromonas schubertii]